MSKNEEIETEKKQEEIEEKQEEKIKKPKKKSEEEFEEMVLKLAEKGLTSEKIGQELKKEGVHSKDYTKKIKDILGAKYSNPDLENLKNKLDNINKHLEKNKLDKRAKRDKEKISAKLRRLLNYLKK